MSAARDDRPEGEPAGGPAGVISIPAALWDRLVSTVCDRHPDKSFGYLIAADDELEPVDCVFFEENVRNEHGWRQTFESYGDYYVNHRDAGFVANPDEAWRHQREIWARNMSEVGIFHSHHRHPANFSRIDFEMHVQRYPRLWHLVVSARNPRHPVVRAFAVDAGGVRELPVTITGRPSDAGHDVGGPATGARRAAIIDGARDALAVDAQGRPLYPDLVAVARAVGALAQLGEEDVIEDLLGSGLLRESAERYDEHIAGGMRPVGPARFTMGSPPLPPGEAGVRFAYGESPAHEVLLTAFEMGAVPVTAGLWSLFDERREVAARDRGRPVTRVSWAEATLFALWMGCRLPTEAEREFASGGGTTHEWCCADQAELDRYAWYCKNSSNEVQPVATREPNALGLYDLHGNVWEWCHDRYDASFYERSPVRNPVSLQAPARNAGVDSRVTRGGSVHGHAEMCRIRYRSHEPLDFTAGDLGFRLVRGGAHGGERSLSW